MKLYIDTVKQEIEIVDFCTILELQAFLMKIGAMDYAISSAAPQFTMSPFTLGPPPEQ